MGGECFGLADRVAADPAELPRLVAMLLDATLVVDCKWISATSGSTAGGGTTTLQIPTPWTAPVLLSRPGRPFTPAEYVRAHRLADLARGFAIAG